MNKKCNNMYYVITVCAISLAKREPSHAFSEKLMAGRLFIF